MIPITPVRKQLRVKASQGRAFAVFTRSMSCETGYVINWDPPAMLVLAWQIDADWQYDPQLVTEVEVRFVAESANVTRVELEHRLLERMGRKAPLVRNSVDAPGGWGAILEAFNRCAETA